MEVSKFFRQFLTITDSEDIWEGQFNLIYHTKGGVTLEKSEKMQRKKFIWFLNRLTKQKHDENEAIKQAQESIKTPKRPQGKMRYLGKV